MTAWDEYLELLDELDGLAAQEARGVADADAIYHQLTRRLQNELAGTERDQQELVVRNRRLQVGIRDISRQLSVAVPVSDDLPPLTGTRLADAMKSAEYDLEQLRRSLDYMKAERPPLRHTATSTTQEAVAAPAPEPPVASARVTNPSIIGISVMAVLVIIAVIALLAL